MIYQQRCGSCIGSRVVLQRMIDRELEDADMKRNRAGRLEKRKERPHRYARLVIQAIELRFEAVQHDRAAARGVDQLTRIPLTAACSVCGGRGVVVAPGIVGGGSQREVVVA